MRIQTLACLALLTFSSISYSATEEFEIRYVGVDLLHKAIFVGVSPNVVSSGCANKDELKWNLTTNVDSGLKELHSIVLAAQLAGKKIEVGISEGDTCVNDHATGWWARVKN